MSFKIYVSDNFSKQAKRLIKKYPSLKNELVDLEKKLSDKHDYGTPLGNGCYKIRLAVKSKGRGKSGGLRVITWVIIKIDQQKKQLSLINLVAIYDKSEFETVTDKDLKILIKQIQAELNF